MTKQQNDPRDIERINPDTSNADTNTNNISVLGENETKQPVSGAVVKNDEKTPPTKKAGGSNAA